MFPNNVGHFIIDGVANSHEWYAGKSVFVYTSFSNQHRYRLGVDTASLLDTDAALTSYYDACVAAGPTLCPLYANSSDLIRTRVDNLREALHVAPVPVFDPSTQKFGVVDYSVLSVQIFRTLYNPFTQGPVTAEGILELEKGNGSLIYQGSDTASIDQLDTCQFDASMPFSAGYIDIVAPILCGDSQGKGKHTFQEAQVNYQKLLNVSSFGSAWFGLTQGPCT